MKKLIASLVLASLVGVAQARGTVALLEPERVTVVTGATTLDPEQLKQAIVRGGAKYDWTVAGEEPGKLRLRYNKQNKHEVEVAVSYDATGFQIRYVNSVNMKYESKNGVPFIHPGYNTWVTNLNRAISSEAGALAAPK